MKVTPATRLVPAGSPIPIARGSMPVGSITGGLLDRMRRLGCRAMITDSNGTATDGLAFAGTVRGAAMGLVRRGMRPDDVVGVLAPIGTDRLTACYAVMAAGGRALPLELASDLETLIEVLASTDARMILVTAPLAQIALELAERSRVRQVVSFGSAPETTPFEELLRLTDGNGYDPSHGLLSNGVLSYSDGGDDGLRTTLHPHTELLDRFRRLDSSLALDEHDTVLLEPGMTESARAVLAAVALWNGASVVTTEAADDDAVRAVVPESRVTVRGYPAPTRVAGIGLPL